jgi:hypothetical protein
VHEHVDDIVYYRDGRMVTMICSTSVPDVVTLKSEYDERDNYAGVVFPCEGMLRELDGYDIGSL